MASTRRSTVVAQSKARLLTTVDDCVVIVVFVFVVDGRESRLVASPCESLEHGPYSCRQIDMGVSVSVVPDCD